MCWWAAGAGLYSGGQNCVISGQTFNVWWVHNHQSRFSRTHQLRRENSTRGNFSYKLLGLYLVKGGCHCHHTSLCTKVFLDSICTVFYLLVSSNNNMYLHEDGVETIQSMLF